MIVFLFIYAPNYDLLNLLIFIKIIFDKTFYVYFVAAEALLCEHVCVHVSLLMMKAEASLPNYL